MTTLNKTRLPEQEQVWLYFICGTTRPGYMGTTMNLQIILNIQKNPYLNQATQKNTCQIFIPKKNPGIENFKPNKILRSSPSLEVRSTPPGHIGLLRIVKLAENNTFLSRSYVKTRRHLLMKHKHNTNTL